MSLDNCKLNASVVVATNEIHQVRAGERGVIEMIGDHQVWIHFGNAGLWMFPRDLSMAV